MPLFDHGVHANAHTSAHTLRPAANTDVCVDMHAHNVWWRGRLWLISRHLYAHAVCTHTHTHTDTIPDSGSDQLKMFSVVSARWEPKKM